MNFDNLFDFDEVNDVLKQDRDTEKKEVGDRVEVIDFSSCTHLNGRPLDSEQDEEMQFVALTYFVVIYDNQDRVYNAVYAEFRQDLIIANPLTKLKYRIASGHVKLK